MGVRFSKSDYSELVLATRSDVRTTVAELVKEGH
jgi:hypothetical protein